VNRDVKRGEVLFSYSFDIFGSDIGQSDVVPVEKRQAVILVFEIQRLSQISWKLMDEAEDALVGTALVFGLLQNQTQIFIRVLRNLKRIDFPLAVSQL